MTDVDSEKHPKDIILVLGNTHASRVALLEAAYGQKLAFSPSTFPSLIAFKHKISTKYYDADVQFVGLLEEHDTTHFSENLAEIHRSHVESLKERVDSIVVLHKAGEKEENQSRLHILLEELVEAWAPNVLLYVADTEEALSQSTSDWCLDNGFEVVGLQQHEEEADDDDEHFKEKVGHARLAEALENNMWGHMIYKTELRPQGNVGKPDEEEDDLDDIPEEVMNTFGHIMNFMRGSEHKAPPKGTSAAPSLTTDEDVDFSEASMERLLQAMAPISTLRDQLTGLPDDQRRKMAAQVAMAMMSMFGDEDDEDMA